MSRYMTLGWILVVAGCAAAVTERTPQYQHIDLDGGRICVRKGLPVKLQQIAGILGTSLGSSTRGVSVEYPWRVESVEKSDRSLGIYVRPTRGIQPPETELIESQTTPLQVAPTLVAMPRGAGPLHNQTIASRSTQGKIGRFIAVCDGNPVVHICARSFHFDGLTGRYSFFRKQLPQWQAMEAVLQKALKSKDITICPP